MDAEAYAAPAAAEALHESGDGQHPNPIHRDDAISGPQPKAPSPTAAHDGQQIIPAGALLRALQLCTGKPRASSAPGRRSRSSALKRSTPAKAAPSFNALKGTSSPRRATAACARRSPSGEWAAPELEKHIPHDQSGPSGSASRTYFAHQSPDIGGHGEGLGQLAIEGLDRKAKVGPAHLPIVCQSLGDALGRRDCANPHVAPLARRSPC